MVPKLRMLYVGFWGPPPETPSTPDPLPLDQFFLLTLSLLFLPIFGGFCAFAAQRTPNLRVVSMQQTRRNHPNSTKNFGNWQNECRERKKKGRNVGLHRSPAHFSTPPPCSPRHPTLQAPTFSKLAHAPFSPHPRASTLRPPPFDLPTGPDRLFQDRPSGTPRPPHTQTGGR